MTDKRRRMRKRLPKPERIAVSPKAPRLLLPRSSRFLNNPNGGRKLLVRAGFAQTAVAAGRELAHLFRRMIKEAPRRSLAQQEKLVSAALCNAEELLCACKALPPEPQALPFDELEPLISALKSRLEDLRSSRPNSRMEGEQVAAQQRRQMLRSMFKVWMTLHPNAASAKLLVRNRRDSKYSGAIVDFVVLALSYEGVVISGASPEKKRRTIEEELRAAKPLIAEYPLPSDGCGCTELGRWGGGCWPNHKN